MNEEIIEFESKVRFFGEIINGDEIEKIFESEAKKIYDGYGIKCNYVSTYIEDIIEDVPEDWYDREEVISDICIRWYEFLTEFSHQNFPPELEKVLDILKQIGYDDEEKSYIFTETGIDEDDFKDLLNALYTAKMLSMEIVDFILSVVKQLVEKNDLTYCGRW